MGAARRLVLCAMLGIAPAAMPQALDAPQPAAFDAGRENQLGLTFSPDGGTAFWAAWDGRWGSAATSRQAIYVSRYRDGAWSEPVQAPFSAAFSDQDPFVSPDGQWLYFVSDRPVEAGGDGGNDDIWRYGLADADRLERLPVNSPQAEYSPVVTASGALYFASQRDGGAGQGDLYRAAPDGDGFHPPENLGAAMNSATGEWNLWVAADESELVFEASSRPSNVTVPGDLYYSWRTPSGWTAAVPVNALNTVDSDLMPRLHPDGRTLFFGTAPSGGHARIASVAWAPLRAQVRDSYAPTLLVANRSSHEVTFVDLASGEVVARAPTGEGPHLLSNVDDGRVVATGYGEFPKPHPEPVAGRPPFVKVPNSRLTLLNASDGTVLLRTTLDGCTKPHASWLVGDRAFVTCETERRVLVLDAESGQALRQFDTQQAGSHVLSFDPATRTLASSNTDSGSLTLIDIDTGDTAIVQLAAGSEGARAIDGRIWVANALAGSVSIVDPRTASVVGEVDGVCNFPIALSKGPQGRVWVACFGSSELVAIEPDGFGIAERLRLASQPLNVVTHPTRMLAYVSYPRENAVGEISLPGGDELRRIAVGIEPDGLRWASGSP